MQLRLRACGFACHTSRATPVIQLLPTLLQLISFLRYHFRLYASFVHKTPLISISRFHFRLYATVSSSSSTLGRLLLLCSLLAIDNPPPPRAPPAPAPAPPRTTAAAVLKTPPVRLPPVWKTELGVDAGEATIGVDFGVLSTPGAPLPPPGSRTSGDPSVGVDR